MSVRTQLGWGVVLTVERMVCLPRVPDALSDLELPVLRSRLVAFC